jgi:hypothetical protein
MNQSLSRRLRALNNYTSEAGTEVSGTRSNTLDFGGNNEVTGIPGLSFSSHRSDILTYEQLLGRQQQR